MRNTGSVTPRPSARSTWMNLPEKDRNAWNYFRKAAGEVIATVDADLQQNLNVGYTDVDALLQLSSAHEPCLRMADLARAVSRTPSAMTRLVDRLEGRSLVKRTRHSPTDVRVEVTTEGLDLLAQAAPRIIELVQERFWSRLTSSEVDALIAICQKLLDSEPPRC